MTALTPHEREVILGQLRDEAISDMRAAGCDCEPKMGLTDAVYGPWQLPAWESEHSEQCALVRAMQTADPSLLAKADAKALMVGRSVIEKVRGS